MYGHFEEKLPELPKLPKLLSVDSIPTPVSDPFCVVSACCAGFVFPAPNCDGRYDTRRDTRVVPCCNDLMLLLMHGGDVGSRGISRPRRRYNLSNHRLHRVRAPSEAHAGSLHAVLFFSAQGLRRRYWNGSCGGRCCAWRRIIVRILLVAARVVLRIWSHRVGYQ